MKNKARKTVEEFSKIILTDISTVLDIGCGKAFEDKIFLNNDINVTGIDFKKQELRHPLFQFIHSDIRNYSFDQNFDLIKTSNFLHFFMPIGAKRLIHQMKKNSKFNLITFFDNKDGLSREDRFFPSMKEIKELYSDWEIISEKNVIIQDYHPMRPNPEPIKHEHSVGILLAKNNSP